MSRRPVKTLSGISAVAQRFARFSRIHIGGVIEPAVAQQLLERLHTPPTWIAGQRVDLAEYPMDLLRTALEQPDKALHVSAEHDLHDVEGFCQAFEIDYDLWVTQTTLKGSFVRHYRPTWTGERGEHVVEYVTNQQYGSMLPFHLVEDLARHALMAKCSSRPCLAILEDLCTRIERLAPLIMWPLPPFEVRDEC